VKKNPGIYIVQNNVVVAGGWWEWLMGQKLKIKI